MAFPLDTLVVVEPQFEMEIRDGHMKPAETEPFKPQFTRLWMTPNPITILALSLWTHSRWTMVAHHTIHGGPALGIHWLP